MAGDDVVARAEVQGGDLDAGELARSGEGVVGSEAIRGLFHALQLVPSVVAELQIVEGRAQPVLELLGIVLAKVVAVSLLHLAEAWDRRPPPRRGRRHPRARLALCQPDRLSPTPTRQRRLALAGRLRVVEGRPSDAVGPLERAIAGWERMSSRERALGETLRDLAAARRALSDPAGADADAERAARLLAVAPPRTA